MKRRDILKWSASAGGLGLLAGKWNKQDISGKGKTGAVLALRDTSLPFPIQADARVGLVSVAAEGTLTNPAQLKAP